METDKKIIELLTQKYFQNIIIHDYFEKDKNALIVDTLTDTLFTITDNFLFSFKDKNDNCWSTLPESIYLNDKIYYPQLGDCVTRSDGIKHVFITKEEVIEMATAYFKKFLIPFYGLTVQWRICHFEEIINGIKCSYKLSEKKFKAADHKKIKAFISLN